MSDEGSPLVSVIIPTHNRAGLLPSAVRSALGQTLRDIEVIVVDDGSTDDTAAVVGELAGQDPRVRAIRQDNRGLGAARNAGLGRARADWAAFLDDDDLWVAPALERLRAAGAGDAVASRALHFSGAQPGLDAARVLADPTASRLEPWSPFATGERVELESLLLRPAFPIHAGLFRASVLRELGGFDERLRAAEDYDLWLRLAARAPLPVVPEVLALVRRHEGQMSGTLGRQAAATRLVLERFLAARPEAWRLTGRAALRRRLAFLAREEAYAALLADDGARARAAAAAAIRYRPWSLKPWVYLAASPWPVAYRRLRWLLRSPDEGGTG